MPSILSHSEPRDGAFKGTPKERPRDESQELRRGGFSRHALQHTEGRQTHPGVHRGAPKGDGSRLLEGPAKLLR